MIVQVDPGSPVPVFEQLREQVERLVASGALAPGSRLPTIRHLAADLGLARGTVQRVYDELARDGWVRTAGRHGTVVAERLPAPPDADALPRAADRLALVARQLKLDPRDVHAALDAALARTGGAPA
ncbi:GntR family transcriptional regulator [Cellulomonas fimi]|uniref:GntR family transcriptional regulator n=1 Tax=Cellulomonas fimi TaxID=1708 RepID=UPI0023584701|nr:GntR family transcriptional regulator [Cellulomonas fimi]